MLAQIAYTELLSFPVIGWLGILTYLAFIATALVPVIRKKYPTKFKFAWHHRIAYTALILATIHAILGLSAYL